MQENPQLQEMMQEIEHFTQSHRHEAGARNVITIPVVVHVVYNTSAENISDAQVYSQIDVLNEDFRRLNTDMDDTWSQAADVQIEFCLATVDPDGNATTGITRTSTGKRSFRTNDDVKKSNKGGKDAWPAGDYMNMWVCDISNGILGYAQFPGGPAATDGIVIDYAYFGRGGSAQAPFDLGRTATHEVGHYLNLRHIWGDGGCSVDDFVSDTPVSDGPNYSCTSQVISCGTVDMVENYMDYTDDACMNLFTSGQTTRMRTLFVPGGFRESLVNSAACGGTPPPPPPATCDDNIQNGSETGVDCGGPDCVPCEAVSCDAPTNLNSAKRKGGREALLSWDAASGANSYLVELRSPGGTWSGATTTNTSITATGLTSGNTYEWRVTSNCSSGTATTAIQSFVSGSQRLSDEIADIAVYPNPASQSIFVDINQLNAQVSGLAFAETSEVTTLSASILDATGRVVSKERVQDENSTFELNVSNLPAGLYILRIQDTEGAIYGATKFMVTR